MDEQKLIRLGRERAALLVEYRRACKEQFEFRKKVSESFVQCTELHRAIEITESEIAAETGGELTSIRAEEQNR